MFGILLNCALLLSVVWIPQAWAAPAAPDTGAASSLGKVRWQLQEHDGARLRVHGSQEWQTINFPPMSEEDKLMSHAPGGTTTPLALKDVSEIQIQQGSSGTGAWVGAAVGLLGGIAAGYGYSQIDALGSGPTSGQAASEMAIGGIVGAGVGAGLGAITGSFFKHWTTIYGPAETARTSSLTADPLPLGLTLKF